MSRFIAPEQRGSAVVVVAEAGVNHNGDESLAHRLIDVAVESGANYVKFQTFDPDALVARGTGTTPYQRARGYQSDQGALLRALLLPDSAWERLRDHAHGVGIGFLSTPFDGVSARLLSDLGVDAIKASSGELTNLPFLNELASLELPLLISTGMGSMEEVAAAVEACSSAPSLTVFHCVSAYPAPTEDCNLAAIPMMSQVFDIPVGWSDHTLGVESSVVAAALGARVFEKHFTLNRTMDGPDHAASLEPDELAAYVAALSAVPQMIGDGQKRRMPCEEENAVLVRRSWHATRDLAVGHVIVPGDLVALRPESGCSPGVELVGETLVASVQAGSPVRLQDVGRVA